MVHWKLLLVGIMVISVPISVEAGFLDWLFGASVEASNPTEYEYTYDIKYLCQSGELETEEEFITKISAIDEPTAYNKLEDIYNGIELCELFELEVEYMGVREYE